MMNTILAGAGLIAAATAFTQPGQQTYGALLTPDTTTPVTTGETFDITWSPNQPADGVTVSLVLCKGPGSNCVLQDTAIAEGVPAGAASYSWAVPCDLAAGTQNTDSGYGMLIIVDGTGEFQYSTQFSVLSGSSCSSSSGPTVTSSASSVTYTDAAKTWLGWSSGASNSTAAGTYTAPSSKYSTMSTITSVAATTTGSYSFGGASSATATTSASPSPFTGGAPAALPAGFANVAGFAAAGLAMFAL